MHNNTITLLGVLALVKIMSSKRFMKAVSGNEAVPANLIKHLQETMKRCNELGLQIPGDLQAQALHFCS